MSPDVTTERWSPPLPPEEGLPYEEKFPIGEDAHYIQSIGYDERGQVAEWAVIQMRRVEGGWQRVAVYDAHPPEKGLHVHLYGRNDKEFAEEPLRDVNSYNDFVAGLDYALQRVSEAWRENERRSDRGY